MKSIVSIVGALTLGALAGAVGISTYQQNWSHSGQEEHETATQIAQLQKQLSDQEERLQRLQWENENYRDELSREPIDFFSDSPAAAQAPQFDPESMGNFGMEGMAALGLDEEEDQRGDEELTEEELQAREERRQAREERRAEWTERREQWVERAQDDIYQMLDEQLMKTNDPVAQERIYALGEYTDYFFNMGERMRQAQSDEERQEMRQEFGQAMREVNSLMEDQRQYMLQQVAGQYADDPAQQQALTQAMRETLNNPFFQSRGGLPMGGPMMGGGPGRGGRGGGGGGGWGGGGGGRGGN